MRGAHFPKPNLVIVRDAFSKPSLVGSQESSQESSRSKRREGARNIDRFDGRFISYVHCIDQQNYKLQTDKRNCRFVALTSPLEALSLDPAEGFIFPKMPTPQGNEVIGPTSFQGNE